MYNQYQQYPQYPQYSQPGRHFRTAQNQAPFYNQFAPTTNKQFVDSLEHALSLPADYNSENVYFDRNLNQMYNICTNGRGEKSYTILYISTKNEPVVDASTQAPVVNYDERLSTLETKVEDLINGKYNVKQTDSGVQ